MRPLRKVLLLAVVLTAFTCSSQDKFTVSGYVKDAATGEVLIGANVYIKETLKGGATNTYGFYSITVEAGNYTLVSRFIGYADSEQSIELAKDISLNVELETNAITTQVVEVTAKKKGENTEGTQMGRIDMDVDQLKTLPALLGEVDIIKAIQFLPGVQTNGEGNSGFYVRGGGPDQNLILLDEATVYNAAHLFGFFSIFNADAIKNIELIKGGMPANYGGRVSSVLDITMRDGNMKEFHGEGGIGLISSRLTLEGPLKKDVGSFIVSGRRTYIDILTKPLIPDTSNFAGTGYYFYDLNAKANWRLDDNNRLYLSGYFGRDVFTFQTNNESDPVFRIPWGNATLAARWNHLFSPKLFMNATATFSDYRFQFEADQDQFSFNLFSGIKYGGQYTYHIYTPNTVEASSGGTEFDTGDKVKLNAHELAVYALDEFDLTDEIRINAGVRLSHFRHVGPYDFRVLDENDDVTEIIRYSNGEKIAGYTGLEPRLSARYRLNEDESVKASVMRSLQFVHLASFSGISLPTDVWLPSSERVKPQIGWQYAAGYFRDLFDDKYEASVEVYYKDMQNLVEYEEGADPQNTVDANFDEQFEYGSGYSYGLELFVKRRVGRMTGWGGYTWSKTFREFENVNQGKEFPSRWDRRHDLSLIIGYDLNERWTFGATFVYATGQAATLPVNRYWIEGQLVSEFVDRNGYRMASYHRADVSATLSGKPDRTVVDKQTGESITQTKKLKSSWTFGIYNVYNRANPYFIFFGSEGNPASGNLQVTANQVSLFSILPSVTWNFEF
jgi:hypothetical protein